MKFSVFITILSLGFVASCMAAGRAPDMILQKGKTWCVVRPGVFADKLQAYLDSACASKVDCRDILPGGKCFEPNTLENHVSYVLNLVYRKENVCDAGIGDVAVNDPSFGKCQYT